jgi:hypothetical protein
MQLHQHSVSFSYTCHVSLSRSHLLLEHLSCITKTSQLRMKKQGIKTWPFRLNSSGKEITEERMCSLETENWRILYRRGREWKAWPVIIIIKRKEQDNSSGKDADLTPLSQFYLPVKKREFKGSDARFDSSSQQHLHSFFSQRSSSPSSPVEKDKSFWTDCILPLIPTSSLHGRSFSSLAVALDSLPDSALTGHSKKSLHQLWREKESHHHRIKCSEWCVQ